VQMAAALDPHDDDRHMRHRRRRAELLHRRPPARPDPAGPRVYVVRPPPGPTAAAADTAMLRLHAALAAAGVNATLAAHPPPDPPAPPMASALAAAAARLAAWGLGPGTPSPSASAAVAAATAAAAAAGGEWGLGAEQLRAGDVVVVAATAAPSPRWHRAAKARQVAAAAPRLARMAQGGHVRRGGLEPRLHRSGVALAEQTSTIDSKLVPTYQPSTRTT
jgi:hypothetical protein